MNFWKCQLRKQLTAYMEGSSSGKETTRALHSWPAYSQGKRVLLKHPAFSSWHPMSSPLATSTKPVPFFHPFRQNLANRPLITSRCHAQVIVFYEWEINSRFKMLCLQPGRLIICWFCLCTLSLHWHKVKVPDNNGDANIMVMKTMLPNGAIQLTLKRKNTALAHVARG